MAPVGGRPFLEILLDQLIDAGCERVILSVGHLRQIIIETFRENYCGVPLHYVVEQTPLGTGGAIRLGLESAEKSSVLILNGDTYLDADYRAMLAVHVAGCPPMTMAITQVEDMSRYGGVRVHNEQVFGLIEKGCSGPGWINAGAYVIRRDFPWPERLPSRFSFETDVLAPFIDQLRPTAFRCEGYFLDIGVPADLDRAQTDLTPRR
jgi:D-glycero-alpha-D-manno-heptose 1-phosphate guanylyltransferase